MLVDLYGGPILVTVAYLMFWYYLLFILQRGTKYRLDQEYQSHGKVFDRYFGQDEQMLAADRAVANTQEQMLPFLVALWLHAVFVSASAATYCGVAYLLLRIFYPLLLGKRLAKMQPKKVYIVTLPSYGIILYMLGSVALAAFS